MTAATRDHAVAEPRAAAFDGVAHDYDAWTDRPVGRQLREGAWRWLERMFGPGDRVLELGCGTGQDAVHLAARGVSVLATDVSDGMREQARRKVAAAGASDLVTVAALDMDEIGTAGWSGPIFDGAFSDFGAINCIGHRRRLARGLAQAIRPGGRVVFVVMSPFCPWEVMWHLIHGQPSSSLRRARKGAAARIGSRHDRVSYPSIRTLRAEFGPWFKPIAWGGLGVALPPTGLAGVVEGRRRTLRALSAVERRAQRHGWSAWAADHYVCALERRPS